MNVQYRFSIQDFRPLGRFANLSTMQWYIPITNIPGIGLIIISTSNLLNTLTNEIILLNGDKCKYHEIIKQSINNVGHSFDGYISL